MQSSINTLAYLGLPLTAFVNMAFATTCPAELIHVSPPHRVLLVELYTSEGCSSCPPADRWLSGLKNVDDNPNHLFEQVVPLSLHVDYWDYIGWKDRFASSVFSQRQRTQSELAKNRVVYTPEVMVNGREARSWHSLDRQWWQSKQAEMAAVQITLSAKSDSSAMPTMQLSATIQPIPGVANSTDLSGTQAYLAVFESGLKSQVRAGENAGSVLKHDFVVRQWMGPVNLQQGQGVVQAALNLSTDAKREELGLAAFVQQSNGEILQATAMPLCFSR